jgi:hypothetical protein
MIDHAVRVQVTNIYISKVRNAVARAFVAHFVVKVGVDVNVSLPGLDASCTYHSDK